MKKILVLALVAVFVCSLAVSGCGGSSSGSATGSPDGAAKDFMNALIDGNDAKAKELACDAVKKDTATWEQVSGGMAMIKALGAKIDLSGMKYTVKNQTSDKADVIASGVMKITMAGQTQEQQIDPNDASAIMKMVNQGGKWVVCQ